jgi:hypothetical protein
MDMSTNPTSRYAASHVKPQGPGDSRPTALQNVADEHRGGDLSDKVVFITGCSSGLGIETARAMKATGARLFLTARNPEKARVALGDLLDDQIHLLHLDLESLDSVRTSAAKFKVSSHKLNILIENAGTSNVPAGKTRDGFEPTGAQITSSTFFFSNSSNRPCWRSRVRISSRASSWYLLPPIEMRQWISATSIGKAASMTGSWPTARASWPTCTLRPRLKDATARRVSMPGVCTWRDSYWASET